MQQDNLNNMNNVTVEDHLAHQAQLQTFNSLNKVWNPAVCFFLSKIHFSNGGSIGPGDMRDSDREKIQFLVLSFLYLMDVAIQATDIKFFYKKKPSVSNWCVWGWQFRGETRGLSIS